MWGRHHRGMATGVIDIGSNTVRLLVVEDGVPILDEKTMLGLGACVEQLGDIPDETHGWNGRSRSVPQPTAE